MLIRIYSALSQKLLIYNEYNLDTFDGESNDEEEDAELGSLTIIDDKLEDK